MTELRKIQGYYCKKCNHTLFSRARHDFRVCLCWQKKPINEGIAVDGGRDYFRLLTGDGFSGEPVTIETELEDWEFYDDWNQRNDKWGFHPGKIERVGK